MADQDIALLALGNPALRLDAGQCRQARRIRDRQGNRQAHRPHMDFDFFRRTSTELCEAILHPNKTGAETILQQYLARIDDARLKRALATVIKVEQPEQASTKQRSKAYSAIWKAAFAP